MNEIAVFALSSVPVLSFVSAGVLEFQRDRGSLRSLTRILSLAVAVVVSIVLLIDLYYPYFSFRLRLSRSMSALSVFSCSVCACLQI